MCRRTITCLAAVAAAALAGCGTTLNLDGEPRIYGGVMQDFQVAKEKLAQVANPSESGKPASSPVWNLTSSALALVDMPLSLLADTLTLPLTIPAALDARDDPDPPNSPGHPRPADASRGR
jgi:uncharacterized protein YceK